MLTICDTHILIFWQDAPGRLSEKAGTAVEKGLKERTLACSDISFWEIAMLIRAGRLRGDISSSQYMNDLRLALSLIALPITPEIASLSQRDFFNHKDPADRLIAATAICHNVPLISADRKLKNIESLMVVW
ncbi:MAG: type II toxin-antitoxin system VapC family toxin [Pseudomonadota bacterium]|nr:type II toxin-antitoxin system VapC family toxin [Pseudomonadota bacterium]